MKLMRLGICIILVSLIVACAPPAEEAVPFSMEVTDQLGRVVKLEKVPERIISLAPSNTEILFALGLGYKVVGVSDYCNYPPEVQEKPSIGGFSTPNIEEVVALAPDLILATSIHEKRIISQLEEKGMTVFALNPKTLDEVLESITLVGEVTGKEDEASHLVTDMKRRIKAVTDKTDNLPEAQRLKVLFITWHDPLWTAGAETLVSELIRKAGGVNLAQELSGHQVIKLEIVVGENPDVIIAVSGHGEARSLPFEWAQTEPRLRETSARKDGRVYQIDANIATRPAPRIVDGLEKFAEFIHPELFKEN